MGPRLVVSELLDDLLIALLDALHRAFQLGNLLFQLGRSSQCGLGSALGLGIMRLPLSRAGLLPYLLQFLLGLSVPCIGCVPLLAIAAQLQHQGFGRLHFGGVFRAELAFRRRGRQIVRRGWAVDVTGALHGLFTQAARTIHTCFGARRVAQYSRTTGIAQRAAV